jgi:hypothetical protein
MNRFPPVALIALFTALGTALPGCSKMSGGATQSVSVTTPPADGAKCILTSSAGTFYVITPGNATIAKSIGDLSVACDKAGFQHAAQTVQSHISTASAGSLTADGIVQLGLNAATGAIYTYPAQIVVPMSHTNVPVASAQ